RRPAGPGCRPRASGSPSHPPIREGQGRQRRARPCLVQEPRDAGVRRGWAAGVPVVPRELCAARRLAGRSGRPARPDLPRPVRALAGGGELSDGHGHSHTPVTDAGEPPAAARARALEALLVRKGVIRREDVRRGIDWLVSRDPADGARLIARAWIEAPFKARLLAGARAAAHG